MLKGLNRATLARAALPDCEAWFRRHQWVHAIWVPLATWVWLVVLVFRLPSATPYGGEGTGTCCGACVERPPCYQPGGGAS